MERIYLDYAATTYVHPDVLNEMMPYFTAKFANPAASYGSAREMQRVLRNARAEIANVINASADEIYFTSGGTESDNWAIQGVWQANKASKNHIVTTAVEHHAVQNICKTLKKQGAELTVLQTDEYARVDAQTVSVAIKEDTALCSIIYANNEVGTINSIADIGTEVHKKGSLLHVDAVCAAGYLPLDVKEMQVDLLSISAHKFYGPKGIGALYVKKGVGISPLLVGGSQQKDKRAGTENVVGAVGLASALTLANTHLVENNSRLCALRDDMITMLRKAIPSARLTGHPTERLCNHVSILLPKLDSQVALMLLDKAGIECSAGAACASGALKPSHVLVAMGVDKEEARTALRFTLGIKTTQEEIEYTVNVLSQIASRYLED